MQERKVGINDKKKYCDRNKIIKRLKVQSVLLVLKLKVYAMFVLMLFTFILI